MGGQLQVSFVDADAASADRYALDLHDSLRLAVPDTEVVRRRADPGTQDFGATLVLVLGTGAVTAMAKGLANWVAARHEAKLRLTKVLEDGSRVEVVIDGQVGRRAQETIAEFLRD